MYSVKKSKKYGVMHRIWCLLRGHSLARIMMNEALARETLSGRTVDVGGAHKPDYFDYFRQDASVRIESVDGLFSEIDFECDPLPFSDGSVDTVVLCNVLEHIYRYTHLLGEVRRMLKSDGHLIGFVPFWVGYHPDPHDYFRYTREALTRIFADAGFKDVRILPVGGGPILANFNTIVLSLPRLARPVAYLFYVAFDALFMRLRPQSVQRNPLGFTFFAVGVRDSNRIELRS